MMGEKGGQIRARGRGGGWKREGFRENREKERVGRRIERVTLWTVVNFICRWSFVLLWNVVFVCLWQERLFELCQMVQTDLLNHFHLHLQTN